MSSSFKVENFEIFIPSYLSLESSDALRDALKQFTNGSISKSLYTNRLKDCEFLLQGDGIKDLLVVNLPDSKQQLHKCIVLSNTCDMDLSNERMFSSSLAYAPIFCLEKYKTSLIDRKLAIDVIDNHINSIRQQLITQIFYLPPIAELKTESIVFLDKLISCSLGNLDISELISNRLFTLSDFGHYLFLFKLSIHFTRMNTKLERGVSELIH